MTKVQDKSWRTTLPAALALLLLGYSTSHADITLDGSLGGPSGPLTGPNYEIPAAVGEQVGSNLFHSFGVFNINTGQSATFTGPNGIENVLGRVTGDSGSMIDGRLISEIPGANLYLINPNGVVFGHNAQLDVKGSFHATTADYVRLGQDGVFAATTDPEASTLTVAPPSAFGFLDNNPASITTQGSHLQVPEGETFSIVGGDINIAGGKIAAPSGRINLASVASPGEAKVAGGSLNVDSFARLGKINVLQEATVDASGEGGGRILIRSGQLTLDNSSIDASTSGSLDGDGITIILNGDLIATQDGRIRTVTSGSGSAGDIMIVAENVTLSASTQFDSSSSSTAIDQAGNLTVTAEDSVFINGTDGGEFQSGLYSNTFGDGDAGNVHISAHALTMENGRVLSKTDGDGHGGDIVLEVENLTLMAGAHIDSSTSSAGDAGHLTIKPARSVSISGHDSDNNPSGLFSNSFGDGDGGRLFIFAGTLEMKDGYITAGSNSAGSGGGVLIQVGQLTLTDTAQIDSTAFDTGPGGNVKIVATKGISMVGGPLDATAPTGIFNNSNEGGAAGDLMITTRGALVMRGGRILTRTLGEANGGTVFIKARDLKLTNGAQIFSGIGNAQADGTVLGFLNGTGRGGDLSLMITGALSISGIGPTGFDSAIATGTQTGRGNAGNISITAGSVSISDGGRINSNTTSDAKGGAGDIILSTGGLSLSHGGRIFADSSTSGRGGFINVTATGDILITGRLEDSDGVTFSQISTDSFSSGQAGNLTVTTRGALIMDDGLIDADTIGVANAGNIVVQAQNLFLTGGAQISSRVDGESLTDLGKGGDIQINLTDALSISGRDSDEAPSELVTRTENSGGDAGDISVSARSLDISDSALISTESTESLGDAGDITIAAADTVQLDNGSVTAQADDTTGGIIRIGADSIQLTRESQVTASVFGGRGTLGGTLTFNGGSLVMLDGSRAAATATQGNGGFIQVNSQAFLHDDKVVNVLDTRSARGNNGTTEVNSPDTDIAGSITRLPISFLNAAALLSQRCGARSAEDTSSFVIIGRGGVPRGPDDWSLSSYGSEGTVTEPSESSDGGDRYSISEGARTADKLPLTILKVSCGS